MSQVMGKMGRCVLGAVFALAAAGAQATEGTGTTKSVQAVSTSKPQAAAKQGQTGTIAEPAVRVDADAVQEVHRKAETKRIEERVERLKKQAAKAREAAKQPLQTEKVFISNEPSPTEKSGK